MSARHWRRGLWLAAAVALGCGGQTPAAGLFGGSLEQAFQCSIPGQNLFVHDTLHDIYFWYRELPDVDPVPFTSPEEYLEAVRYRPLDRGFSFITTKAANDAFLSESQIIAFGFTMRLMGPAELRVADVFSDSPAAEAGLHRGARLLQINGRTIADLVASGELGSIFGPSEVGVRARVRYRALDGSEREAEMVKRVVTIPTVSEVRVFATGGRVIGYIGFKNFVQPSVAALDAAFARLAAAGASELVLDLRYNGGGLISVAQHLAGLIGGPRTRDQVLMQFVHNDKNRARDRVLLIPQPPGALGLQRLFVITTRSSASASELIINGLRPHLPVVTVGDATFGKPVGQYSFEFCEKVLVPVSFATVNARGEGDYFDGLPPDCAAPDDLDRPLGDPAEASLSEALRYISTGTCSASAAAAARALASRRPPEARQPHREDGWQQLVGAY